MAKTPISARSPAMMVTQLAERPLVQVDAASSVTYHKLPGGYIQG